MWSPNLAIYVGDNTTLITINSSGLKLKNATFDIEDESVETSLVT